MSARFGFVLALVAFALGLAATGLGLLFADSDLAKERVSQWSNLLFLVPAVRAVFFVSIDTPTSVLYPGAWAEAIVFFVTFFVSTAHHGCFADAALRRGLAVESIVVLFLGAAVFSVATYWAAFLWVGTAPKRRVRLKSTDEAWSYRARTWLLGSAFLVALAFAASFVASSVLAANGKLDGCLWIHSGPLDSEYEDAQAPALEDVWDVADFVTAFSALVVAVLFLLHVQHSAAFGLFWMFAILILVGKLGQTSGSPLLTQGGIIAIVLVFGFCAVLCQCVVWCTYPDEVRAKYASEYEGRDFGGTVVFGVSAILLFVFDNTRSTHAVWHALGALALYYAIETRYGKVSFFIIERREKAQNI